MKARIFWVAALTIAIAPVARSEAATIGKWGVDLTDQDHSVRPGDDFFRYQNGAWVARAAPDVRNPFMSYWRDVRNVAPARLKSILDQLAAEPADKTGSPSTKAADLYREFLDEAAVARLGGAPLEPELRAIRAARTKADIARIMGSMEGPERLRANNLRDAYGRGLFVMNIAQDAGHPNRNALYLVQGARGTPVSPSLRMS
jgi:putative endopeptidase